MRAVCTGECMAELRQADRGLYALGFAGDAYNAAVYLKRSAPQMHVNFLTVTGESTLSRAMRECFAAEGVEDAHAFVANDCEIGLYMIDLDAAGERRFHYWRSASAARCWFRLLMQNGGADRLAGVDLVCLSGVSLAILPDDAARTGTVDLLRSLKGRVGKIAFDANLRPALWRSLDAARTAIVPMIRIADVFRASGKDAALLTGAREPETQIAALRGCGAQEIALTLGAEGCIVATRDGAAALPARAVKVKDASGAGDAFTCAYLAARLSGAAPVDAAAAVAKGVRLCANVKPCLLRDHPLFAEAATLGLLIADPKGEPSWVQFWDGIGAYLDFTQPKTLAWSKAKVKETLLDYGITATWNDNNEFEIWTDKALAYGFGQLCPAHECKPLQSLLMMRASRDVQKEHAPDKRPFLVSRSGSAGGRATR